MIIIKVVFSVILGIVATIIFITGICTVGTLVVWLLTPDNEDYLTDYYDDDGL